MPNLPGFWQKRCSKEKVGLNRGGHEMKDEMIGFWCMRGIFVFIYLLWDVASGMQYMKCVLVKYLVHWFHEQGTCRYSLVNWEWLDGTWPISWHVFPCLLPLNMQDVLLYFHHPNRSAFGSILKSFKNQLGRYWTKTLSTSAPQGSWNNKVLWGTYTSQLSTLFSKWAPTPPQRHISPK